ncbi:25547_t:CDS:1 [Racocetra persica]|uniref:25547_t:CDS:1 n=1 Tax=Racocetra persica TaxID=160502 RepID=A0ACA9M610_9GLOM|nr:25547_t:CDS:1 [Racocetra persica]
MSLYKAEKSEFRNRYLCNTPLTKIHQNNIQPINYINEIQPDSNYQNHKPQFVDNDLSIEQLISAFTWLNTNENSSNNVIENSNNQNHEDFNDDYVHQNHSR